MAERDMTDKALALVGAERRKMSFDGDPSVREAAARQGGDQVRTLAQAGALIIAELERELRIRDLRIHEMRRRALAGGPS